MSSQEILSIDILCAALERARETRGNDDGPWSVGVRGQDGVLQAHALLDNYAQVKVFARAMEDFGYEHCILGSLEDSTCCDFTFRLRTEGMAERAGDLLPA